MARIEQGTRGMGGNAVQLYSRAVKAFNKYKENIYRRNTSVGEYMTQQQAGELSAKQIPRRQYMGLAKG